MYQLRKNFLFEREKKGSFVGMYSTVKAPNYMHHCLEPSLDLYKFGVGQGVSLYLAGYSWFRGTRQLQFGNNHLG